MQGTAHEHLKAVPSIAQDLSAANANGIGIDCRGYVEALCVLGTGPLTGTSPTLDVKWQESSDNSTFTDISGAAHAQVLVLLNRVVTVVNLTNVALTIAAQPSNPARLVATIVDTTPGIVAGTITYVGTRPPVAGESGNQAVTEIVSCAAGAGTYTTTNTFVTVTSATAAAFSVLGGSGDETVKIGVDNSGPQMVHIGRLNLAVRKRYVRAVSTKAVSGSPVGAFWAGLVLGGANLLPVTPLSTNEFNVNT